MERCEETGECPVCGTPFPVDILDTHVNSCLDRNSMDSDALLVEAYSDHDLDPPIPVHSLLSDARLSQSPSLLHRHSHDELPMLDGFRNESFGLGQAFNISRLKRDGGVFYLSLKSLRFPDPPSCNHKLLSKKRLQNITVQVEFEDSLCHSVQWNPKVYPRVIPMSNVEFVLIVNEFYGPIPVTVSVYRKRNAKLLVRNRPQQLIAKFSLRLSDGFLRTSTHLDELGNVLSVEDAYELAQAISDYRKLRNFQIVGDSGEVAQSHLEHKMSSVPSQNNLQNNYGKLDSATASNACISNDPDPSLCFMKDSATQTYRSSYNNAGLVVYSEIKMSYFSFTNLFVKSEPNIKNWIHPLHVAVFYGSQKLVDCLFEQGGKRRQPELWGRRTCAHIAAMLGDTEILSKLLEGSPEEASKTDSFGRSAAHYAVFGYQISGSCTSVTRVLEVLHQYCPDLDSVDQEGTTCLLLAAEVGCTGAVEYLLSLGAKPTRRNCDGDSALSLATQHRRHKTMSALLESLESKELLDMYNHSGRHCLSIATDLGDVEAVKLLLSKGARQWSSPIDGQIPLHIAASQGHVEIIKMLMGAMVSVAKLDKTVGYFIAKFDYLTCLQLQLRDKNGETVFVKARKGHHEDIYNILEEAKRNVMHREEVKRNRNSMTDWQWKWNDVQEDTEYFFFETQEEAAQKRQVLSVAVSPQRKFCSREMGLEILEESTAAAGHQSEVREIALVLQGLSGTHLSVPLSTAGVLLRHFRWNTEKLVRDFAADPEGTCELAGISLTQDACMLSRVTTFEENNRIFCGICMEWFAVDKFNEPNCCVPEADGFALSCNHWFCKSCWSGYFHAQLSYGPGAIYATCPAAGCREVCHEDLWNEALRDDPEPLERYSTFLVRSYIDLHPSLKWCGSPRCRKAVYYTGSQSDVTCACGFKMCFKCGHASHSPATCYELRQWKLECEGEGKDLSYILKTSKQCPKCGVAIHRVAGCNHLRCKICRHEFCWICLGPWTEHGDATGGFYQCNLYDPVADLKVFVERKKTDDAMSRFLHYLSRYQNHEEAQEFAQSKRDNLLEQMEEEKDDFAEMKLKLLITALDVIIESRRVLKYTYVSAYYTEDNAPKKNLFEHLQEMLEKNTEYLQEFVEQPDEDEQELYFDFEQLRNFTQLTKTFSKRVIEFAQS